MGVNESTQIIKDMKSSYHHIKYHITDNFNAEFKMKTKMGNAEGEIERER